MTEGVGDEGTAGGAVGLMAASRTSLKEGWATPSPDLPDGGVSRHQRSALIRPAGAAEGGVPDAGKEERGGGVAAVLGVNGGGWLVAKLGASGRGEDEGDEAREGGEADAIPT